MISHAKTFGIMLASIMFIWAGYTKVVDFNSKVDGLVRLTNWPRSICNLGMVAVIILEILGFLLLVDYFSTNKMNLSKTIIKRIIESVLLFLVVVTLIYHPLKKDSSPIPFLNNLTTFGLFLYVYGDLE